MNIVVTQTAINASVSDQNISVSAPQFSISASVVSSDIYASLSQTQINASVSQPPSVGVSLPQTPISVAVSSNGGGNNHDPVTLGIANGLSLSGQVLSLALSATGTVGALSAIDYNTFNSKLSDAPSNGLTYGRNNGAWVNITGTGGSSLPVADTTAIVMGSSDPTKLLRFEVDGFSAGATRVLTPPNANATIAGLEVANVFTAAQRINVATASAVGLTLKSTDDDETNNIFEIEQADGSDVLTVGVTINPFTLTGRYQFRMLNGLAAPDYSYVFSAIIVDESTSGDAAGLLFINHTDDGYSVFQMRNDLHDTGGAFEMGLGGSGEAFGYDNVAYFGIGSAIQFLTFDAYETGQYFRWLTAIGETMRLSETALTLTNAINVILGTGAGTKIATATSQKLSFWNATPIIQPTTAVAAATFVANAGTAVNDASTFDGYTIKQVVKALRNTGLLA